MIAFFEEGRERVRCIFRHYSYPPDVGAPEKIHWDLAELAWENGREFSKEEVTVRLSNSYPVTKKEARVASMNYEY